jgi:hypothetical protein
MLNDQTLGWIKGPGTDNAADTKHDKNNGSDPEKPFYRSLGACRPFQFNVCSSLRHTHINSMGSLKHRTIAHPGAIVLLFEIQ